MSGALLVRSTKQGGARLGAHHDGKGSRAIHEVRIGGEILSVGIEHFHRALAIASDHLQLSVG
jgi:hypothetical protein